MGLFRPYERPEAAAAEPEPTHADTAGTAKPAGKDAPTPTRREAEAARRERLNPTLSPKEAKVRERAAKNHLRDEQFTRAEAQPGKVLARDFVDAHRGVSQWSMPLLMVALVVSLMITSLGTEAAYVATAITYGLFVLIALDIFLVWRKFKKLHAERLPNEPTKGLLMYIINRSINLRRLRLPAPRVKPGDTI